MKPRASAVYILNSLNNFRNYEQKIDEVAKRFGYSQQDVNFIYNLVKGVIQYHKLLDYVLQFALNRPINKLEKTALNLLRIGAFQSIELNTPSHAFVYETCEAAKDLKRPDLVSLLNAVLRHLPEEETWQDSLKNLNETEALSIKYSHPEWLLKRWIGEFGIENTKKLLMFNNDYQSRQVVVRHNPLKCDWEALRNQLKADGYNIEVVSDFPIHFFTIDKFGELLRSKYFQKGLFSVQDFSQSLPVTLLAPKQTENILDVCAAPGGKSTYIAQLVSNNAHIVSSDISDTKISMLKDEIIRLGINCIKLKVADATKDSFPFSDKILIDAPCSGTGVISKRADMRWNRKPEDINNLVELQLKILTNMARFLRKNGAIVYSTCSLEFEENWGVIEKFLKNCPNFQIDPAYKFVDGNYCDNQGAIRILPFKHNFTGSFAVRLVRVS
jgi:16S rRNA (cytosine967-C5)-methyltransferase